MDYLLWAPVVYVHKEIIKKKKKKKDTGDE